MSSAVATISGCQIAGTIYKVTELYEEIGNKISYIPVKEDITTDNFFKYIYSDEVSKDKAASDQCSYYVPTAE